MSKLKLILAEDNDSIREVIKEVLINHEFEVYETRNGCEALNTILNAEFNFDVLLTDSKMPSGSGTWLLNQFNHHHSLNNKKPAFIIYISGFCDLTYEDQIRMNIDLIIEKPINFQQLPNLILEKIKQKGLNIQIKESQDIDQRETNDHQMQLIELGTMVAGIAHEINNPLSVILGKCSIILKKIEMNSVIEPKQIKDIFCDIQKESKIISKIVKSLSHYSRNSENEPLEETDFSEILNHSLTLCSSLIRQYGITVQNDLNQNVGIFICNPTQLTQILTNLIRNACHALENNIEPIIKIKTSFVETSNQVKIQVIDNGHGIPEKIKDKIFTSFFTTKERGKGTGLGLSLSQSFIQKLNGDLILESTGPEGTCFTITLPFMKENNDEL